MNTVASSALLALMMTVTATSHADTYPSKAITMVVPYASGGSAEVMGRVLAQQLGQELGQPVVLDIRAGAGTMIGSQYVAKMSKPDGYTLLLGANPLAINVALLKLPFSPLTDLAPVGAVLGFPSVVVTSAEGPFKDIKAVINASKTEQITYGSSGQGTVSHMAGELFQALTDAPMTHVPYKGSGAVYPDLIAGRISVLFDVSASAVGFVHGGKVRALAVTSKVRSKALPDVPTLMELGVKDYEAMSWFGLFAPAGTPPEVVLKVNAALNKVVADPGFLARIDEWGGSPLTDLKTPEDLGRLQKEDTKRWVDLVSSGKVKRLD
ncbi:tripartite tricarboxylate transporter substrate binding protein [soil metagenome]